MLLERREEVELEADPGWPAAMMLWVTNWPSPALPNGNRGTGGAGAGFRAAPGRGDVTGVPPTT
jgi:hypothetical protein